MDIQKEIEKHYDKIYRYCYYKLNQKELAEDMTQETFLRFYQKTSYHAFEQPIKILYTIARNLCIDEMRRKSFLPFESMEQLEEKLPSYPSAEDTVLSAAHLKEAMANLTEMEQELIFLRLVNKVPISVIGNMFSISRFAVYRRLEAALEKLRKELA